MVGRSAKAVAIISVFIIALISELVFPINNSSGRAGPRNAADLPILVDGDDAWGSVPGVTGDGSEGSPYLIKDKVIDAGGSGDGIMIQNTTKYFTIRNCTVTHSAAMPVAGIHIYNATNGIIERNNCSLNGGGIFVEKKSANITIRENNATGNEYGIVVYDLSSNVTVAANNASANVWEGIDVSVNCTAVRVENNTVSYNQHEGILFADNVTLSMVVGNNASGNGVEGLIVYETFNTTFARNCISGNQFRGVIISDGASNNTFDGNSITANFGPGLDIYLGGKNNTFVRNNFTSNTGVGMKFYVNGDGNLVYLNRFQSNGGGNAGDDGASNRWDNGSQGNFWHDYTGQDGNDDGIGDVAWGIPGTTGSQDYFPLWSDGDHTILINGDPGWTAFRAAGNCTGSGTAGNPYVIAGKQINATSSTSAIWVENSTRFFLIQDCLVTNPGFVPHAGIRIANATNGNITSTICTAGPLGCGILLGGNSTNITIQDNRITGCGYGIVLWQQCTNITVVGNNASANLNVGIALSNVTQNMVEKNIALQNGNAGIQVVQYSANNTVYNNLLGWNTQWGIVLSANAKNNTLQGNNVTHNYKDGIYLAGASSVENNTIRGNIVAANLWNGILLDAGAVNNIFTGNNVTGNLMSGANLSTSCSGNWFRNNYFSENALYNAQDDGTGNHWDNGTRGNYWADYAGADPDDDGIGNIPYAIAGTAGVQDRYPIWDDGDDTAPVITGTGFTDNQLCGASAPNFALTINDASPISEAWVSYDGGAHNWTCGVSGTLPGWDSLGNGTLAATFWANDTAGNVAAGAAVPLRKDREPPVLLVTQPILGTTFTEAPAFALAIEDAQFQAAWYTLGSDPTRHFITGTSGTVDAAAWAALPAGEVTITFHANDTLGNEQVISKNVTKQATGGDFGWYLAIGGGIALLAMAGVIIVQKKRKGRAPTPP